jgi:hypothetical protein
MERMVLEFLNNLWVLGTSRNRVVVPGPAMQLHSLAELVLLESVLGLPKKV